MRIDKPLWHDGLILTQLALGARRSECIEQVAEKAAAIACWGAATDNEALLTRIGTDLGRYSTIPAPHDAAKCDALQALVADRDQLDRYARTGVPLRLSFGMYRGAQLMPVKCRRQPEALDGARPRPCASG